MRAIKFCLCFIVLPLSATAADLARLPDGGGPVTNLPGDELGIAQRQRIDGELMRNVSQLKAEGKLAPAPPTLLAPMQGGFVWPLRPSTNWKAPGYHGISNFVDLDLTFPNHLLDYNCGARTYDQAGGYNHAGIDMFLWPFPWLMMDQTSVEIVAAAPGTIIGKQDGFDDRSCPNNYSADWNAVYIQHGDGTVAWYGHMKKSSLTTKAIGASVAAGEFLGDVGSAGFSSGPHLHFENHSAVSNYTVLEPYTGACNAPASLWAQQRSYYDSAINMLATHSAPPDYHGTNCPNPVDETPNFKDNFMPGQVPVFGVYYRDQLGPQLSSLSIVRPDGSVFQSWTFRLSDATADPHYAAAYWLWNWGLPANAPSGLWHFRVTYEGITYNHDFTVGDVIFASGFD